MRIEVDFGSNRGRHSLKKWGLFLLPLVLVGLVLWLWLDPILSTLSPFALAFIFAYLINPAVDWISGEHRRKFRINRALSIFILLGLIVVILVSVIAYVVPNLIRESSVFASHFRHRIFPVLKEEIQPRLDEWFARRNVISNNIFRDWDSETGFPVAWEVSQERARVTQGESDAGGALLRSASPGWVIRQELASLIGEVTLVVETGRQVGAERDWNLFLFGRTGDETGDPLLLVREPLGEREEHRLRVDIPETVEYGTLGISYEAVGDGTGEIEILDLELVGPPALPIFDLNYWVRWSQRYQEFFTLSSLSRMMTYGVRGAGVVAEGAGGVWAWLSATLGGVVSLFIYLILLFVIMFYMLLDFSAFKKSCVEILPDAYEGRFVEIMRGIDRFLGGFIRGQATICLAVGLLVMGFMFALSVPFAFLIGLGAGLFNFIPYLGPAMGMVPAVTLTLLGFLEPGADWQWMSIKLAMVLGSFMVVQAIDGFILSPKILSESVDVPPLVVMGALMLGGSIAGVTGMVLAIPVYCILRVLVGEYQKELDRETDLDFDTAPSIEKPGPPAGP
jgi:predicted PurR-regulated permease PerM